MRYQMSCGVLSGALISLAGLMLGGCTPIFTEHPIGEPIAWSADDEVVVLSNSDGNTVLFKKLDDGRAQFGRVAWDGEDFAVVSTEVLFTAVEQVSGDDANYIHTRSLLTGEDDPDFDGWHFARVMLLEDDGYLVFSPRGEIFAKAVEEGELPGEKAAGDSPSWVYIRGDEQSLEAFIDHERMGEHFDLDDPLMLRPVGRFEWD